jgi:hypothetical protein
VCDFLQFVEAQKAARSLDGMDGAKDASQRVAVMRIFLQPDQIAVQPIQVFIALREKILDDVAVALCRRS